MSTIAIFGGSFDPPHLGHLMAGLYVLEVEPVDELWLVPTYRHAFGKELTEFEHRMAMCEIAARSLGPRAVVSDIERALGGETSRTLDTLQAIAREQPGDQLRLVIGSDILGQTGEWHRWDELAMLAPPIVVPRQGYEPARAGVTGPTFAIPDVSSTEVRERLARGETAVPLVPRAVMEYIAVRGLYR